MPRVASTCTAPVALEGGRQQLEDAVAHDGDVPVAGGTTSGTVGTVGSGGLVLSVTHGASFTIGGGCGE